MAEGRMLETLKMAFGVYVARLIVDADDVMDYTEMLMLARAFPTSKLAAYRLIDEHGQFTVLYDSWRERAMEVLPRILTDEQKLEMMSLFHGLCMADGDLDPAEMAVMYQASDWLGLPREALYVHLDQLTLGPNVEVPGARRRRI